MTRGQGFCPACLLETGLGLFDDEDENGADQEPSLGKPNGAPPIKMLAELGDYELLKEIGRTGTRSRNDPRFEKIVASLAPK